MTSPIITAELEHLAQTLRLIDDEYQEMKATTERIEKEYQEGLKEVAEESNRDDAGEMLKDLQKFLKGRNYAFKKQFLLRLKNQLNVPYFARLGFLTDLGHDLDVYIGKHAFFPENKEYQIADWRSPVASLYYNFSDATDNVSYSFQTEVPGRPWILETRTMQGNLHMRRNIEVEKGQLLGVYDNNLRIDLLGSELSKKSGGKLEDIVKTIQTEQNVIIRSDPNRLCVVQGTAGSGKTTVAVHRLAYLFYTFKERIREDNTLLLSSSKVLVNYVAQTLPELEIYSLARDTLDSYLAKLLTAQGYEVMIAQLSHDKNKFATTQNSLPYVEALERYISDREQEIRNRIADLRLSDYFPEERYFTRMHERPILETLGVFRENLEELLEDAEAEKKHGNYFVEPKIDRIKLCLKELSKVEKEFNPVREYERFLKGGYLKAIVSEPPVLDTENISVDDISSIFYLAFRLKGTRPDVQSYAHIVVDEGQDLGILNYHVVKMLGEHSRVTILGDLNQATTQNGCITEWKDLEHVWPAESIDYYFIAVSYRTTYEIIHCARRILEHFPEFRYLPEAFERHGTEPRVESVEGSEELMKKLVNEIRVIRGKGDERAIGIVPCGKTTVKGVADFLSKQSVPHVIVDENFAEFSKDGIYVVPEFLAKGLEFSSVFILDPTVEQFPVNQSSAKRLFVLATRAINELVFFQIGPKHPLIDS